MKENWYEEQGWGINSLSTVNYTGFIPVLIKDFKSNNNNSSQQTLISS